MSTLYSVVESKRVVKEHGILGIELCGFCHGIRHFAPGREGIIWKLLEDGETQDAIRIASNSPEERNSLIPNWLFLVRVNDCRPSGPSQ